MHVTAAAVIDGAASGDEDMIADAAGLGDAGAKFPVLDLTALDGAHRRIHAGAEKIWAGWGISCAGTRSNVPSGM